MSKKIIDNVKILYQMMDDGSMLLPDMPVVYRLMQVLGSPSWVDYDYIMSISGAAVRLSWQQGWAGHDGEPNQSTLFINGDELIEYKRVFSRLGVSYSTHYIIGKKTDKDKSNDDNIIWNTPQEAKKDIVNSINRGIPVIINEPYVTSLILGYEDDGSVLYGISIFAPKEGRVLPHNYNKIVNWENEIKKYFLISNYTPRCMDKELLTEVFETAVELARTVRIDKLGDTALGISAFDALAEQLVWDESFEVLEPDKRYEGEINWPYDKPKGYYSEDGARSLSDRFWKGYCDFLCMLYGYSSFSRFLKRQVDAGIAPEWSNELQKAAKYYDIACDYADRLWDYVTPDNKGVAKFKNKEVRYTFAAHMLRAKIYTIKAVEELDKLLAEEKCNI